MSDLGDWRHEGRGCMVGVLYLAPASVVLLVILVFGGFWMFMKTLIVLMLISLIGAGLGAVAEWLGIKVNK